MAAWKTCFPGDGTHYTAKGYDRLAIAVAKQIEKALGNR
ncbi:MAG: hypothetical protein KatS3mg105_2851 [Gemmatales bacterium]|nr:MAG: hypothetical protein KatS3mg105_2851 [Gemmatales bacterium]